ncbi:MAG: hypothetical protein ACRC92_14020 [Peptostreptococcaceae bacterium]
MTIFKKLNNLVTKHRQVFNTKNNVGVKRNLDFNLAEYDFAILSFEETSAPTASDNGVVSITISNGNFYNKRHLVRPNSLGGTSRADIIQDFVIYKGDYIDFSAINGTSETFLDIIAYKFN